MTDWDKIYGYVKPPTKLTPSEREAVIQGLVAQKLGHAPVAIPGEAAKEPSVAERSEGTRIRRGKYDPRSNSWLPNPDYVTDAENAADLAEVRRVRQENYAEQAKKAGQPAVQDNTVSDGRGTYDAKTKKWYPKHRTGRG